MSCLSTEAISELLEDLGTETARAHLAGCSRCSRRAAELRGLDKGLRGLPLAAEEAPASLRATLRGLAASDRGFEHSLGLYGVGAASAREPGAPFGQRARARFGAWVQAARERNGRYLRPAMGLAAATMAVAFLVIAPVTGSPSVALADEAVHNHLAALALGDGTGCQVESQDPAVLAAWVSESLGQEIEIPSLGGATLVGARRCSLLGEETAAIVYRAGGTAFSLYLPPKGSAAAEACTKNESHCVESGGQTVCLLGDPGGSPWVMVGGIPGEELCSTVVSG